MNTYRLKNGWTAQTVLIDAKTGKEIEWTEEIRRKITERMFAAIGYKVILQDDKDEIS